MQSVPPLPPTTSHEPSVAATPASAAAAVAAANAKPKNLEKKKAALAHQRISYPFWFGGSASSFAACVTHPLDLGTFCDQEKEEKNFHMSKLLSPIEVPDRTSIR